MSSREIKPKSVSSRYYDVGGKQTCLAIRREDQSIWERRAPLSPVHVRKLVRCGVKVLIQPSNQRVYSMKAYSQAGATISEDLSEADLILGVKQVPIDSLIDNKMFCFFSHTTKGQEMNMPLLDAILEKNVRLLDYERMRDKGGKRLVAFGKCAGVAGIINILHGLGLRLLALGHHTPFLHIKIAHNYQNTAMACQAVKEAGYKIAMGMMPKSLGPLIFVFTGSGNVSQGAQEFFQELPHEYVPPEMLPLVAKVGSTNKLYACQVSRKHHILHKETGKFCPVDFDQNPQNYISNFAQKIAPYTSVLINGIFWGIHSPKLLTIADAKNLCHPTSTNLPYGILAICDISADPCGSIEFMTECTTIDQPFVLYDPDRNKNIKNINLKEPGILICSIDNMPTQLPRESTDLFGALLLPFIPEMLELSKSPKFKFDREKWSEAVGGAVVATNGKLTKTYEYIADLKAENRTTLKKKTQKDFEY